jgi:hypothetical protein
MAKLKNINMEAGTRVTMVNCLEAEKYKDRVWVTESKPWRIPCGEWLVLLQGFSGGFAVKFLREVKLCRKEARNG